MLDDRSYMREPEYRSQSVTITLLIVTVACFVVQCFFQYYVQRVDFYHFFALSYDGIARGRVWQLLTFQFLHAPLPGGLLHLLLNCLGIFAIGKAVEEIVERKDYLRLYLGSGILGGLAHLFAVVIWPSNFRMDDLRLVHTLPVVGASAGLCGLLGLFGTVAPFRQMSILVFYIFPITVSARLLLLVTFGLTLFGMIFPMGNVSHWAHFGGLVGGMLFGKFVVLGDWSLPFRLPKFFGKWAANAAQPTRGKRTQRATAESADYEAAIPVAPPADFISKEVDPILDKISAHGIQSLSDREKKILEAARARMAKK